MTEWFADTEFWELFGRFAFTSDRFARGDEEVDQLLAILQLAPTARLLDVGCGPGRHALAFAARGHLVTALDLHMPFLQGLRDEAENHDLKIVTVNSDMRRFRLAGVFDVAICLGLSFGYFESREDDIDTLSCIHAALRPGGRLVLDVPAKNWPERDGNWFVVSNMKGDAFVERLGWGTRVRERWSFSDDRSRSFDFRQHLYEFNDVTELLHRCEFKIESVYGSDPSEPFTDQSRKFGVVARK